MFLALGTFVFGMDTLPYQQLQRSLSWRHPTTDRVGARAARQFLGVGDESVRIQGVLAPEVAGDVVSLAVLEQMANDGDPYPLVNGAGAVLGVFVITAMDQTGTYFYPDGSPRRIEFSLTLDRTDDDSDDNSASA